MCLITSVCPLHDHVLHDSCLLSRYFDFYYKSLVRGVRWQIKCIPHNITLWYLSNYYQWQCLISMLCVCVYFDICLSILLYDLIWTIDSSEHFSQHAVLCAPNRHSVMAGLWTYLPMWQLTRRFMPTGSLSTYLHKLWTYWQWNRDFSALQHVIYREKGYIAN